MHTANKLNHFFIKNILKQTHNLYTAVVLPSDTKNCVFIESPIQPCHNKRCASYVYLLISFYLVVFHTLQTFICISNCVTIKIRPHMSPSPYVSLQTPYWQELKNLIISSTPLRTSSSSIASLLFVLWLNNTGYILWQFIWCNRVQAVS